MVVSADDKSVKQSQATDNAAVETAIAEHLKSFNDANAEPDLSQAVSAPGPTGNGEPKDGESKEPDPKLEDQAVTDVETPPDESVEDAVDDDDDDSAPILPASLRRTAKRLGWSDGEIDDFAKGSYEGALKTFGKMHESTNAMTSEWADLGRRKKTADEAVVDSPPAVSAPAVQSDGSGVTSLDENALLEEYGEEHAGLIRKIVGPVNQMIEQLKPMAEQVQASQAFIASAEEEAMGRELQKFFTAEDMKPFHGHYGTDLDAVTSEQLSHRNEVLELADAIIVGAKIQGRSLSPNEAMIRAHDSVTAKMQEETIRDNLKKKAKDRRQGISLTPSHQGRTAGPATGPAKNEAELEARTQEAMRKVFG